MTKKLIYYHLYLGLTLILFASCGSQKKEYASFDEYPVRTGDLTEMIYSPSETKFTVWAPAAEDVRVMLFESGDEGNAYKILKLEPEDDGTWSGKQEGDLRGKFYTFNVKVKGKWLGDTPGLMAKAVGVNGQRAAILRMDETNPKGWEADASPALKSEADIVLYQLHYQDFSADTASGIKHPGKYLALTETGSRNTAGLSTGTDHLKELGVTHVQLMPSFDFSGVDEAVTDRPQYSAGFGPLNYNVPEGSYSSDARKPEVRIREFKQMIQALHKAGFRVVMDVAYDQNPNASVSGFERTAPGYFYRASSTGASGNQPAAVLEAACERPMMRKFMTESLLYWMREYHIDGFCFNRTGPAGMEAVSEISKTLKEENSTLFIYVKESPLPQSGLKQDSVTTGDKAVQLPGVTVLNTGLNESLLGKLNNRKGAFLLGWPGGEEWLKSGIAGIMKNSPVEAAGTKSKVKLPATGPICVVNYLNLCDYNPLFNNGLGEEESLRLQKLAWTILFTSQGIPFIYSGDEWADASGNRTSETLQPVRWNGKTTHKDFFDYCKGLVQLRQSHPAFCMADAGEIKRHLEFIPVEGSNLIAYRLKEYAGGDPWEEIIVVLNSNKASAKVTIPEGKYTVVCRDNMINLSGLGQLYGGEISVPGQSALLIYK